MATYYVRPDGNNANTGLGDSAAAAWQTAKYGIQFASNGVVANGDTLYLVADQGNYTENSIVTDRGLIVRGLRGTAVIDGTGGAAGSDIVTHASACTFIDVVVQNAVDKGWAWTGSTALFAKCGALNCGGDGFYRSHAAYQVYCYARGCNRGFNEDSGGLSHFHFGNEAADSTSHGFVAGDTFPRYYGCLAYDSGGDNFNFLTAPAAGAWVVGCTAEGAAGDGFDFAGTPSPGFFFANNAITNNAGVGSKAAGSSSCWADYNNYYGNGTDRTNMPTGSNDTAVSPGYTNAASDDYTLAAGSAMVDTGYSPFKTPMKMNKGSTSGVAASSASGGGVSVLFPGYG